MTSLLSTPVSTVLQELIAVSRTAVNNNPILV